MTSMDKSTSTDDLEVKVKNVYQFKITLKFTKPKIWRRIQVPEEYTFKDLHFAIQNAMGWGNCHMHEFRIKNPKTGQTVQIRNPDWEDQYVSDDAIPEDTAKVAEYFSSPKDKVIYEYDFGDGWEHEIVLEKTLPAVDGTTYPQCLAGRRACPPENCGGVRGYKEFLEIIANPNHEEYENQIQQLYASGYDKDFHPEKFNPKSVFFDTDFLSMQENCMVS